MEVFARKLHTRMGVSIAVVVVLAVTLLLNVAGYLMSVYGEVSFQAFWQGSIIGFSIGAIIAFLLYIARTAMALSSPARLRARYAKDNDERTRHIDREAGKSSYWIELVGLLLGVLVGGYFSFAVSLTCFLAGVFIVLVRGVLKLYYGGKY